jgi:hypothetical protein
MPRAFTNKLMHLRRCEDETALAQFIDDAFGKFRSLLKRAFDVDD